MFRIILAIVGLAAAAVTINCGGTAAAGSPSDSPTDAYKRLYAAVKSKDTEAIKHEMTNQTIEFAKMAAAKQNTPIEKVFENGFTGTTFAATLPPIRDQRVVGDMGAIEVWNAKDNKWENLPFMREDGAWKLGIGELFAGTWKPDVVGRGRAFKEAEAANAAGAGPVQLPGSNANMANMPINGAVANTNRGLTAAPGSGPVEKKAK